jgi:hypothetical protein
LPHMLFDHGDRLRGQRFFHAPPICPSYHHLGCADRSGDYYFGKRRRSNCSEIVCNRSRWQESRIWRPLRVLRTHCFSDRGHQDALSMLELRCPIRWSPALRLNCSSRPWGRRRRCRTADTIFIDSTPPTDRVIRRGVRVIAAVSTMGRPSHQYGSVLFLRSAASSRSGRSTNRVVEFPWPDMEAELNDH